MSDVQHIAVKAAGVIPQKQARNQRARAWAFAFECFRTKKAATSPVSRPDDELLKHTEGVGDVNRRPS